MKREDIFAVVRQQVKKLRLLASGIRSRFAPEDIHAFRVEVKKLRAFMRLATAGNDTFRLPKDLRHIYKALGIVRDLQLQRQNLPAPGPGHQQEALLSIHTALETRLDNAIKDAKTLLPKKARPFPNLTAHLCTDIPIRFSGLHHHRFVRQTLQRLNTATIPLPPDDTQLHDIRRAIKDLLYAWPYLSNQARHMAAAPLGGCRQLTTAAQLLGDYLDAVSLAHLHIPADGIAGHTSLAQWKQSCQEKTINLRKTIDNTLGARLFSPAGAAHGHYADPPYKTSS